MNKAEPKVKSCVGDVQDVYDRENSASVIQELQSVLAVMTSEKQRDMWKQQLFPSRRKKVSETTSKFGERSSQHCSKAGHVVESEGGSKLDSTGSSLQDGSCRRSLRIEEPDEARSKKDEKNLRFFKKPASPGRAPLKWSRRQISSKANISPKKGLLNKPHLLSEQEPDWTRGLGIGFASNLTLEAVNVARQRVCSTTNSVTYGSDDSTDKC